MKYYTSIFIIIILILALPIVSSWTPSDSCFTEVGNGTTHANSSEFFNALGYDNFDGVTINSTIWDVSTAGGGTIAQSNGAITINSASRTTTYIASITNITKNMTIDIAILYTSIPETGNYLYGLRNYSKSTDDFTPPATGFHWVGYDAGGDNDFDVDRNGATISTTYTIPANTWINLTYQIDASGNVYLFMGNGSTLATYTGYAGQSFFPYIRFASNGNQDKKLGVIYRAYNGSSCPNSSSANPVTPSLMSINGSLNSSSFFYKSRINASFNATANFNLSFGQITINDTGTTRTFTFDLGNTTPAKFSQNFTISCAPCVVNITGIINDSNNNKAQNTTIISVSANIVINATDLYDGEKINNFTVNFTGPSGTFNVSTNNGLITISNITNGVYDITFSSLANGGYFDRTYEDVSVSGQIYTGQIYQVEVSLNASEIITGLLIANFTVYSPLSQATAVSSTTNNEIEEDLASSSFESQNCATGDGGLNPAIDGNWFTNTSGGTVVENYTKPNNMINASFIFKGESSGNSEQQALTYNVSCFDGNNFITLFSLNGSDGQGGNGVLSDSTNKSLSLPSACLANSNIAIKIYTPKVGPSCNGGIGFGSVISRYYEGAMNFTIGGNNKATLYLKAGSYNLIGNKSGYINSNYSTGQLLPVSRYNLTLTFGTHLLRIEAKSLITNAYISNFSIVLANGSYTANASTINGNLTFIILKGNWTLNFSGPNFADTSNFFSFNSTNNHPNYTFSVYTINSINISIWDEILGKPNNLFFNRTVFISFSSSLYSTNVSTGNATYYIDLLTPGEYRITYSSEGYTARDYYLTLNNRSNNLVELFLLSTGNSTNTVITIQDENARNVEGSIVKMLRYYTLTNSYEIVAMAKTDINGEVRLNREDYNAFYYFIIEKSGLTYLTTNAARLIQNTITYGITIGENVLRSREATKDISNSLTFSNSTGVFRFTYNDASGLLEESCLIVEKLTVDTKSEVCNQCSSSSSSTLLCTVNTSQSGTYIARGQIETTTKNSPYVLATLSVSSELAKSTIGKWGLNGVYAFSYLFMGLALIGLPFPWLSIFFSVIGLIFSSIVGIIGLGYSAIASILIIAAIIMYRVK